jgi:hypothetical protein
MVQTASRHSDVLAGVVLDDIHLDVVAANR